MLKQPQNLWYQNNFTSNCCRSFITSKNAIKDKHLITDTHKQHFCLQSRCIYGYCTSNSALTLLVGPQEGHLACENWVVAVDRHVCKPRLVDCRIGVVNKLDRRRVLLTTLSTCHGEFFFESRVWGRVPEGYTISTIGTEFPYNTEKSPHAKSQFDSSSRFDTTPACDGQTDRRTNTRQQHIPR